MHIVKHETMRHQNAAVLLQCVREHGPITRHEIQEHTGLSWGAISSIASEFLACGVLCQVPAEGQRPGRTPSALDIDSQNNLLIGIDLHSQGISCVVMDLRARRLCDLRDDQPAPTREAFLQQAFALVERAMEKSGFDRDRFLGIGVSVQGSVDTARGVSLHSPHLPDWREVPLGSLFEERFGLPVALSHDTNAMVLAEQWNGKARNVRNLVFIRLDKYLGMSLVIDNRLYTGTDGTAGEFGHMIINPDGPRCTCGNYGCVEAYASGRSLLERAREGGRLESGAPGSNENSYERDLARIARAARDGGEFERGLFDRLGYYLGVGISNLLIMLNPEIVVISGDMVHYADLFMERLNRVLRRNVWNDSRIHVELSELDNSAAAVGAALNVAQQLFEGRIEHPIGALIRAE